MSIAHVFLFVKHLIFIDESRVHNMSTSNVKLSPAVVAILNLIPEQKT